MTQLVQAIKQARYMVAFSGAGMDTESKLPDFRGPDGLWKNHDPRVLASTQSLAANYDLFHEFYAHRIKSRQAVTPHAGHAILARWEDQGLLKAIITQNVSGLHAEAGSRRVIELHGSLRRIFCQACQKEASLEDFLARQACSCGGRLRPGVTLFGEMLPQEAFRAADRELARADLILILGTSLEVFPAAQLPFSYPMRRVYVDLEAGQDRRIEFHYREKIGPFLNRLDQALAEA